MQTLKGLIRWLNTVLVVMVPLLETTGYSPLLLLIRDLSLLET